MLYINMNASEDTITFIDNSMMHNSSSSFGFNQKVEVRFLSSLCCQI